MHAEVSIDQLAACCDERPEDIRRWQDEGLLSNPLTLRDAERVRLIRALERRGLSAEIISLAFDRHNDVIDSLLDQFGIPDASELEAARDALGRLDVEHELLDRIVTPATSRTHCGNQRPTTSRRWSIFARSSKAASRRTPFSN